MTTWQKVRVTFTDADGNEVAAVMWAGRVEPEGRPDWVHSYVYDDRRFAENDVSMQIGQKVAMVPIRELPTGVGAVIKVVKPIFTESRDLYCHTGNGWWTNGEGSDISAHAKHNGFDDLDWPYEILSEGVQL